MVPLIECAGLVDALVALQPNQSRVGGLRDGAGQFGLADTGGAFDQQWLAEPVGEEHRGGRCGVRQVAGLGQSLALTSSMSANSGAGRAAGVCSHGFS